MRRLESGASATCDAGSVLQGTRREGRDGQGCVRTDAPLDMSIGPSSPCAAVASCRAARRVIATDLRR